MNKVAGVDQHEQGGLTEVRRCPNRRQAEQYALVLTAMGMRSSIVPEGNFLTLYVAPEDAERADDELATYDSENRERPHERDWLRSAFPPIELAMVYWVVLLFFFAAGRHEAFSLDWIGNGAVQSGLMLKGEWWRAVTALCLHANGTHLLGNLLFGTVFLLLLAQVTGAGVAGLSIVVAGAVGNVLSALVQSPAYTSIGASTAIFGSIGMLVALRQVRQRDQAISTLRKWTPLAGGFGLLISLGLSGENTDIIAHILGFGAGIAAGWMLAKRGRDWATDRRLQWRCAGTAGAVVVFAWVAALA